MIKRILKAVQEYFHLNKTNMAQVLGVQRADIVNWLSGDSKPPIEIETKLIALEGLGCDIPEHAQDLMHVYNRRALIGKSLFDLLCEKDLSENIIKAALVIIIHYIDESIAVMALTAAEAKPRKKQSTADIHRKLDRFSRPV